MAHQFIHTETYGLHSRNGKSTASGIVAEAERLPTHSKHVTDPKRPKILYGIAPSELLNELQEAASTARDRTGKKKLPKDAKILLAGVISMPLRSEDYLAAYRAYRADGKEKKPPEVRLYGEWRDRTIEFLKSQYGDGLRSIVLHYDEEYLHLHFFAGNKIVNGTLNLDGLDCASDAERALGMDRKARNASGAIRKKVRTQALKRYQDMYYETVARFLGWARVGPKNPRMTSQQYAQHKRSAADLLAEKESTATAMEQVERLTTKLTTVRRMYKEATEDLVPKVAELLQLVQRLKYQPDPALLQKVEQEVMHLGKKLRIKM